MITEEVVKKYIDDLDAVANNGGDPFVAYLAAPAATFIATVLKHHYVRKAVLNEEPSKILIDLMYGECPSCNKPMATHIYEPIRFCKHCGCAVKWSFEENGNESGTET